jgi:hypothetical protein
LVVLTCAVCTASNLACRREPAGEPVATLTVTLNHERVITGSVLEALYRFDVAPNTSLLEDYRVFVHMTDEDGELLWGDDHDPPIPTTAWKAAQVVEYTRTNVVPPLSYVGDATLQVGLFSTKTQHRLPLKADHVRHGAYRVAHLQVRPETDGPMTVFEDGWHLLEASTAKGGGEWRWTKQRAILAFQNPRVDSWLYLDLDSPLAALHQAQQVQLSMGGQVLDTFTLPPDVRSLRKVKLPSVKMGNKTLAELRIDVDRSFVPALASAWASDDTRELGVRVFHVYIDALPAR